MVTWLGGLRTKNDGATVGVLICFNLPNTVMNLNDQMVGHWKTAWLHVWTLEWSALWALVNYLVSEPTISLLFLSTTSTSSSFSPGYLDHFFVSVLHSLSYFFLSYFFFDLLFWATSSLRHLSCKISLFSYLSELFEKPLRCAWRASIARRRVQAALATRTSRN